MRCGCGTLFYPGARAPDYALVEAEDSFYLRADQAEAIDASAWPVFVSDELGDRDVVDVGCGIGFTADLLRFGGRTCEAFDPSAAARQSTRELRIPIENALATAESVTTSPPRLVYSSEVIEHVPEPAAFLANLRAIAGDDGYVIVTTPNAEHVLPSTPTPTVLAMLGAGQHLFLLSEASLSRLAQEASFGWVHCWTAGERLFLIAGPRPVRLGGRLDRATYAAYLAARLHGEEGVDRVLRFRAFGYRLFKEHVHAGRYAEAEEILGPLIEAYTHLGIDLTNPADVTTRYREASGADRVLPTPRLFPMNVPLLLHLCGTLTLAYRHDRIGAHPMLQAAIDVAEVYRRAFTGEVLQTYDVELQQVASWSRAMMRAHGLQPDQPSKT